MKSKCHQQAKSALPWFSVEMWLLHSTDRNQAAYDSSSWLDGEIVKVTHATTTGLHAQMEHRRMSMSTHTHSHTRMHKCNKQQHKMWRQITWTHISTTQISHYDKCRTCTTDHACGPTEAATQRLWQQRAVTELRVTAELSSLCVPEAGSQRSQSDWILKCAHACCIHYYCIFEFDSGGNANILLCTSA